MLQEKMTINEIYVDVFGGVEIGTVLTRQEIIRLIQEKYDVADGSILPSDLCYNSSNKGVEKSSNPLNKKLFIKVKRGVYRYVGTDFDDSKVNSHEFGTI